MLYFFVFLCKKMIRIVCNILTIAIEDLKVYLSNSNLLLGKNAIKFKVLVKKKETSKQMASIAYYYY